MLPKLLKPRLPRYGSHQMVSLNSVGRVFISNCYKWVDLHTTKKRLDFTIGKEVSDKKSGLMFDFVILKHKRADDFASIADAFRPASKMNPLELTAGKKPTEHTTLDFRISRFAVPAGKIIMGVSIIGVFVAECDFLDGWF